MSSPRKKKGAALPCPQETHREMLAPLNNLLNSEPKDFDMNDQSPLPKKQISSRRLSGSTSLTVKRGLFVDITNNASRIAKAPARYSHNRYWYLPSLTGYVLKKQLSLFQEKLSSDLMKKVCIYLDGNSFFHLKCVLKEASPETEKSPQLQQIDEVMDARLKKTEQEQMEAARNKQQETINALNPQICWAPTRKKRRM